MYILGYTGVFGDRSLYGVMVVDELRCNAVETRYYTACCFHASVRGVKHPVAAEPLGGLAAKVYITHGRAQTTKTKTIHH